MLRGLGQADRLDLGQHLGRSDARRARRAWPREVVDGVDFVVNPRFEGKPTRKASAIIAFGEGGEVKIIRE